MKDLIAIPILMAVVFAFFWLTHDWPGANSPTCVLLTDTKPFNLVVRNGHFMLCTLMNDDSLDVECRVLEEKPCR